MATQTTQTTIEAAQMYLDLSSRVTNPAGTFDKAGRFFLADRHSCCSAIRCPSRAFPWSEMVHGRTIVHVAAVTGVDVSELRRAVRAEQKCRAAAETVAA